MKTPFKLTLPVIFFIVLSGLIFKSEKNEIQDFVYLNFQKYNGKMFVNYDADSMINHQEYSKYGEAMWAYNHYIFSNYSTLAQVFLTCAYTVPTI